MGLMGDGIDFEQGAALGVPYLSAYRALVQMYYCAAFSKIVQIFLIRMILVFFLFCQIGVKRRPVRQFLCTGPAEAYVLVLNIQ